MCLIYLIKKTALVDCPLYYLYNLLFFINIYIYI
nr:MAG TPA: hypothetical protein [Bacteriophage sp.]